MAIDQARVTAFRLRRHHLDARVPRTRWLEVSGDLAGLHAQVLSSAELMLWARVRGAKRDDLRVALWEERTLAKTWLMRGTLHVVRGDELALFALGRGTQLYRRPLWLRYHELAEADLERLLEAIGWALDGACLSRAELTEAVVGRAGERYRERLGSGWGEFLKPAACAGLLIHGPPRGHEVTFVRPDQWLPGWTPWDPEAARRELVRRYLRVHGPADRQDFTWWIGLEPPMARPAWEDVLPELEEVEVDGRRLWCLAGDVALLSRPPRRAAPSRLLPAFDPFVLGHKGREHVVDPAVHARVYRQAGWVSPVVVAGGRVAGIWSPQASTGALTVTVEPFRRLSASERSELEGEVDSLARWFDLPPRLSVAGPS